MVTFPQKNLNFIVTYTLELLENNLEMLEKDNLFLDNLERILDVNPTLVSCIIIILSDKRVDFFSKFLSLLTF